jgi:hypothetical protein
VLTVGADTFAGFIVGETITGQLGVTAEIAAISGGEGNSILIGNHTSTGGYSNSIAMGAYATNTSTNQFMIGSDLDPLTRIETLVFNGGTGNTCSIDTNTGITCSSDERLKTDIVDLDSNILDSIAQLRTVTYKWNSGTETTDTHIGFIAQNVQELFPELVTQNQDGMLSVNYANITPVLAEGIKELNLKINNIESFASIQNQSLLDNLIAWFADKMNGINKIFVKELCLTDGLDEECLTLDQVRVLKNSIGQGVSDGYGYGFGGSQ